MMMRKDTRYRLFIAVLLLCYMAGTCFLLWRQSRAFARRLDRAQRDFESRLAEVVKQRDEALSSAASSPASASTDSGASAYDGPWYFVRGSGRTGRWGYIDILFADGARNRYYYRIGGPESKRDLERLTFNLEVDSFLHQHGISSESSAPGTSLGFLRGGDTY